MDNKQEDKDKNKDKDKDKDLKFVYEELVKNKETEYFNTYNEFVHFCGTDFTLRGGLNQLFNEPKIEIQNKIIEKVNEYNMTHDSDGKQNKPIIYSTVKYRRNSF